jgi:hypothetical protein
METNERKYEMSNKIKDYDILVSVMDQPRVIQKEYEKYSDDKKYKEKDIVDDLDNQHYSEGEQWDD